MLLCAQGTALYGFGNFDRHYLTKCFQRNPHTNTKASTVPISFDYSKFSPRRLVMNLL